MEDQAPETSSPPAPAGLSPAAQRVADWLRDLARTARTARLYRSTNFLLEDARESFARKTLEHLAEIGSFTLRVTPEEILYGEELLVHPPRRGATRGEAAQRLITELPFLLYRDGVRELTVLPGVPRRDLDALVDALAMAWSDRLRADDVVTALWQANPTHVRVEAAPPEQTLYVASGTGRLEASDRGLGLGLGLPPLAGELHGDLGDRGGAVGLHRETGLEDTPSVIYISPRRGYESLLGEANAARDRLLEKWSAEKVENWREQAGKLLERVLAADPSPEARATLARYAATGVALAIEQSHWGEALACLELVRRVAGPGPTGGEVLEAAIHPRENHELGEALDEAAAPELDAFFRLVTELGPAGTGVALGALSGARKPRTRAAACAALTFLCADRPEALAPALHDPSSEVVALVVSILGHIGGRGVAPLCLLAVHHTDPVVTREVARIVPALPEPERTELVLELLGSADSQTLLLALRSASRGQERRIAERIVTMIGQPSFDERPEEVRRTLFQALADTGDSAVVPFLEGQLTAGGWFARPSWRRTAAAHVLRRLAVPEADAVLERGSGHASEAVRAACREAGRKAA